MCLFKDIYDKSLAVEAAVNKILNKYDCEIQGTYILDNYKNPTSKEELNAIPTYPLVPKEHDYHIDEVIIKYNTQFASSFEPTYTITNVFNYIQLFAPFYQGDHAYNTFYIVDDTTCRVYVFNLYFETKGQATIMQEIGRILDVILRLDGKNVGFPAPVYRNAGGYINWLVECTIYETLIRKYDAITFVFAVQNNGAGIFSKPKTLVSVSSLGPEGSIIAKVISAGSSSIDAL
ncbi:MAG: hypothetical protein EZS28_001394 [Streblomastix strix]|uniref:Uncharacterized protein n=1 Tax=Streblomastix strix TaxID=222440 RepID=A0A5J4X7R1_9EUKA|nr:MAG: hypothetical protein EZS28_001394 [Streblomastix strix]